MIWLWAIPIGVVLFLLGCALLAPFGHVRGGR